MAYHMAYILCTGCKAVLLNVNIPTFLSVNYTPEQQKYGASFHVRSTTWTVLDGFFPYSAQMITSMRGCVARNDLWSWPISSRLFSCDVTRFMDYIHMWHKYNLRGATISRSIDQRTWSYGPFEFFAVGARGILVDLGLQFLVQRNALLTGNVLLGVSAKS